MENALRIIIAKSPAAMHAAIQTIQAIHAKSPILQIRYNNTVEIALADPEADFTPAERAELAEFVGLPGSGGREFTLRVRLTDSEREAIQSAANAAGMSMSEYTRRKLFE